MPQGMADRFREAPTCTASKGSKDRSNACKGDACFVLPPNTGVSRQMRIACDTCGTGQPNYIALYTVLLSRLLGSQRPAEAESV